MRLHRALAEYELDGDEKHLKALENTDYPGLWWPDAGFKEILDLTVATCEQYEAGEIDGDKAADVIFEALNACEGLNPVFGWKGPETARFIYPSTVKVAQFVYWAARHSPQPEMRDISRSLITSAARSAMRGKKPL
jgi:FADH2 O2-dependent halogenase